MNSRPKKRISFGESNPVDQHKIPLEARDEEIILFCDHIKRVLNVLDSMLSIFRKKHGEVIEDDLVIYEQSGRTAGDVALAKAHKEALRLLRLHGGIGELLEDNLEQSHQKMDRIHERVSRLGFSVKRAMAISRLAEMVNNPDLKQTIAKVRVKRKSQFKLADVKR